MGDLDLNRTKRACRSATTLVLLIISGSLAAAGGTYYRWIDASGTPVSSDRPPPTGIQYEILSTTTNRINVGVTDETSTEPDGKADLNHKVEATKSPTQPRYKKDPKACANAMKNLEILQSRARIRLADGNGNYRYVGQEEKEAELAKAEAIIAKNCD